LSLTARQSTVSLLVALFNRRFQPQLDQLQHFGIADPPGHRSHKLSVRDFVKVLREVRVDNVGVAALKKSVDAPNGIQCALPWPIRVRVVRQIRFEDRP
jgi:hypothetical protein